MVEHKVRLLSEGFARTMDRRGFLKRTSAALFAGMAALAAGHTLAGRASATNDGETFDPDGGINCAPPGPYCNTGGGSLSGCMGSRCFQHTQGAETRQCRIYYTYYQAGCWTTLTGGGYWTCCDCECPRTGFPRWTCGCAQYRATGQPPPPQPDGPKA